MKKLLIVCGITLFGVATASAQLFEPHLGVSAGVGTTGITIDASATLNSYLGARFGIDIMPKITVKTDLNLGIEDKTQGKSVTEMSKYIDQLNEQIDVWNGTHPSDRMEHIDKNILPNGEIPNKLDVEGKLTNTTWHFLVDVYPFGGVSSFHVTAGAYFGPEKIISVYNKTDGFMTPINQWNNAIQTAEANPSSTLNTLVVQPYNLSMIGAELGDYFITPNPSDNGNVEANIKVNSFRPYLGVGFGRAVPKGRVGCQFDLGVQFWGTPKVYAPTYDKNAKKYLSDTELKEENAGGDAGGVIKTISKVSVYPVLNFRLIGRIF